MLDEFDIDCEDKKVIIEKSFNEKPIEGKTSVYGMK